VFVLFMALGLASPVIPHATDWAGPVFFVGFVAYYVWITRRVRRFNAEAVEALRGINRGSLQQAATAFSAWVYRHPSGIDRTARHNLAWTRLREGNLDAAVDLLVENERRRVYAHLATTSAVDLALCHALIGRLEIAQVWLDEADRRARRAKRGSYDAMRAFTAAVIDQRSGGAADAARSLEEHWVDYEGSADGQVIRPLRVLRAFVLATAQGPRAAGQVESLLVSAKPVYPTEYDFLGTAWPEMHVFLAAHSLASR
jgi:hypothetical protein